MSFEDEVKALIRLFVGYSAICVSLVLLVTNHYHSNADYSREEITMHALVIVLGLGLAHPEVLFKLLKIIVDKLPTISLGKGKPDAD
jgi:hypothetical protein